MDLFFRKEGQGFPLVILHGLYGSSDNWLTVGKMLSRHFEVFMPDLRNHGRSPKSEVHSYQAMADDLARFYEQNNIQKSFLMGHSMGGKVAMNFAADYPERIEKLIVVDICPKDYFLLNESSQYYLHLNILRAMLEIDFTKVESRKQVEDIISERIDGQQIVQFLIKNIHRNRESNQYEWRLNVPVLYEYLDDIIRGVDAHWFDDRLPIKNYPVLFIRGALSNYILPEDYMGIRRIYPEAEITEIPDAGHWLHAEQTQLFIETCLKFLQQPK